MLKRTLVFLGKLLLFVAVIWLMVAAYWKYTDHVVSSEDLLIYFLILPLGLLLGYWLLRIVWSVSKKTFRLFSAPGIIRASPATAVSAGGFVAHPEINPPVYVMATAVSTHFGDEGGQFLEAVMQQKMRAEIDQEMTQEMGYGVRAARVDSLEQIEAHDTLRASLLRTRALLHKIYQQLDSVMHGAAPSAETIGDAHPQHKGVQLHPDWRGQSTQNTASRADAPKILGAAMPTRLSIHLVLPTFLTGTEISLVQADVSDWLHTAGWSAQATKVQTIQPENEIEYLRRLQAWQQAVSDASASEWLLVLSAVSWLDIDLLNHRLDHDSQFADRLSKGGAVIGELACGMVLAKTPPDPSMQLEPIARLSRITLAQRNKPVDAKGTIAAELLTDMLADQTVAMNEADPQFLGLTTSADLNNGRAIELGKWVTDSLPQLDFIEDVLCVGEQMGDCESSGSLLALVLAAAMAEQREGTVLYCANQHATWRAMASVMPSVAKNLSSD